MLLLCLNAPVWLRWPHGLQPSRLLCLWDSPGKNIGVGCHFLLLGIFLTQGLTEPTSPVSPALVGGFFPTETIVQSKHNFICAGKPKNARDSFILVFAFLWWCGSKPTSPRYTCIYEERGHAEHSRCHSQEDRAVRLWDSRTAGPRQTMW